ncbi:hypothetical protein SARC_07115 [Sphaeroforma arctica JP610]|uniref:Uncharacterized protein n=1 Tax=Sphaeroforma arctica JP610 TaxID=667725 RepID=A0A0L0FUL3_9EUKA|nr:hypothetical protein SARC_07115 [Sphaeroforma arctica JP610]KNC80522.1 hypothetical protein SARC_07115 [Sphaeroforma arctica JP610]|eukprot:XP_014154424.1 hypothetical protein SARC_07115 [Sphaeroforma arctica JP610]
MSNLRQSRRQQHLTHERREEDYIDRRRTKCHQSVTDHTGQRAENGRIQASKTPRGDISLTKGDVVINDEAKGDPDLRADRGQSITGEHVASSGLPSCSSLGISGASSSGNEQPRLPPNKRRRHRRRSNNKGTVQGQSSTKKLTELMVQHQSLLEKYEQRLKRTSSERPTTVLSAHEALTSPRKRRHRARGREDNPTFRIQGRSQQHHGLGCESPGSIGQLSEEEETLSSLEEAPLFQEFAREQVLAKQIPHGQEALKNRQDQMSTTYRQQQQRQSFERAATSQHVQTSKRMETTSLTPPPTPASIEKSRQVL